MRFRKKERRVLIGYVTALSLLLLCFLLIFYTIEKEENHSKIVERTNITINNLQQLETSLKDGVIAFRGYVISRKEFYTTTVFQSSVAADASIGRLEKELEKESAAKLDSIKYLAHLNFGRIDSAVQKIRSQPTFNNDSLVDQIAQGKILLDNIKTLIDHIQGDEQKKLSARTIKLMRFSSALKIINAIALALAVILAAYSLITFVRENRAKLEYRAQLEKGIAQLKDANEELVKLRQIDQFAASGRISRAIAHEVRNPLTNISLAAEQLGSIIPGNEENTLLIDMIKRNASRINKLITELINSTKFEQLDLTETTIEKVLEEALLLAKDRIGLKGISVKKSYETQNCQANVDTEKLKTAFLNLMVNAIEAMETGKGVLSVSTERDGKKCIIKISDNGIGMSPESMSHIFEPYFSQKEKGHGLGLTLAQGIILNHDGKIDVESKLGAGTTFIITLLAV